MASGLLLFTEAVIAWVGFTVPPFGVKVIKKDEAPLKNPIYPGME